MAADLCKRTVPQSVVLAILLCGAIPGLAQVDPLTLSALIQEGDLILDEAASLATQALARLAEPLLAGHFGRLEAEARLAHGRALLQQGAAAEARAECERAVALLKVIDVASSPALAAARRAAAQAASAQSPRAGASVG